MGVRPAIDRARSPSNGHALWRRRNCRRKRKSLLAPSVLLVDSIPEAEEGLARAAGGVGVGTARSGHDVGIRPADISRRLENEDPAPLDDYIVAVGSDRKCWPGHHQT